MSGIGHLAAGFAVQPSASEIPLWVLLAAGETNDLLYGLFSSLGLESKAVIVSMDFIHGVHYLTATSNPWSHGLFMSLVWSLLALALGWACFRKRRSGLILGGVVFSHWLLDFLMHSNLPLFFAGSPLVGVGLENSGAGFLFMTVFDLMILAVAVFFYLRTRRQSLPSK
jgi:membrane-bound metal-dependent hydrolase YbcI (DUF457 family)